MTDLNASARRARSLLLEYLNSMLGGRGSVLDIGCGDKELSNGLVCGRVVTLDVWKPFEPDIWCDLAEVAALPCEDGTYDMVLLLDVIEHLPKDKGFHVLREAKRVSGGCVVVLTPLWWDPNLSHLEDPKSPYYQNNYDRHLSLWTPEDLIEFERVVSIKPLERYFLGVWRRG